MPPTVLYSMVAFLAVFLAICGLSFLILPKWSGENRRTRSRLRELSQSGTLPEEKLFGEKPRPPLAWSHQWLKPRGQKATDLKTHLVRAGLFHGSALTLFPAAKLLLLLGLPLLLAGLPYMAHFLTSQQALLAGALAGLAGLLAPDLWLTHLTKQRQGDLRRSLPDTLDMLVMCLEGGESLMAAIQRVTTELQVVHPALGAEMNIL